MEKPMTTEGPRICLENLFCTKTNTSPKFVVKTQKESPGICSFNQPSQNDRNWPFHPPLFERPGLVLAGKSWFTYETDGLSMAVYHLSHWAWNQKCQLHLHHPPGFPGHTINPWSHRTQILNGWADEPGNAHVLSCHPLKVWLVVENNKAPTSSTRFWFKMEMKSGPFVDDVSLKH